LNQDGSIGILKLDDSSFETIMRSHSDSIVCVCVNSLLNVLITVSDDNSIRVWHVDSLAQVSEFLISNEKALCVSSTDHNVFFVAGFNSGYIRVFDLQKYLIVYFSLYS